MSPREAKPITISKFPYIRSVIIAKLKMKNSQKVDICTGTDGHLNAHQNV